MTDHDFDAAFTMLAALALTTPGQRLDTLAFVMKVVIERPDFLDELARKLEG